MKTNQRFIYNDDGKEDVRITTTRNEDGFRMYVSADFNKFSYCDLNIFVNEVMKDRPNIIKGYAIVEDKMEQFILLHDDAMNEIQVSKWRNYPSQIKFIELTYND